jgi:site-specific DNA-methyltransferase (adenine-specific)
MKITEDIELYHMDNMKLMAMYPDNHFDIAIVDPPYGIDGDTHRENHGRSKLAEATKYHDALWDQEIPKKEYFEELERVSKHQIIFGINYFTNVHEFGPGRIVWDKVNAGTTFSDAELAYCSKHDSIRLHSYMWNGMMQGSKENGRKMEGNKKNNEVRIHPTQKPVRLYEWLLMRYVIYKTCNEDCPIICPTCKNDAPKILDTHLGSGSIAIAAHNLGCQITACDKDITYFKDATERIKNHVRQTLMFK